MAGAKKNGGGRPPAPSAVTKNKQRTLFFSPHGHWAIDVLVKAYGGHSVSGTVEMAILKFLRTDPETQAYMARYGISEQKAAAKIVTPEVEAP